MVHNFPANFLNPESHDGGKTVSLARRQQVLHLMRLGPLTHNILMAMGYCCILSSFYNRLIFYDDTTTTKSWDWDDENLKSPLKNREELVSASDLKVPTQNYSFHPSCQCVRSVCVFLIHRMGQTIFLFQTRSKSRASSVQI